jgi:hypothetical protein
MSDHGRSKQSTDITEELRPLPVNLIAFKPHPAEHHPVGRRKLEK